MGQLYNFIKYFRNGDTDAFLSVVMKFEPQLNKLQRNSSYEDMKNDLILFMFELLNKIPLEKEVFKEDKYIISYINKSLKHKYIYLNKINCKSISNETLLEETYMNNGEDSFFSNIVFKDLIKTLTEIEADVIVNKYKFNYSEA